MPPKYEIAAADWPKDTEEARALLTNYGRYLAASPTGSAGVCIVGYETELRDLPGKYLAKEADLLLARVQGESAAVSYTHLDVYKRQNPSLCIFPDGRVAGSTADCGRSGRPPG